MYWELRLVTSKVKVSYPLKQGLKHCGFFPAVQKSVAVKVSYPLKQGLKPGLKNSIKNLPNVLK